MKVGLGLLATCAVLGMAVGILGIAAALGGWLGLSIALLAESMVLGALVVRVEQIEEGEECEDMKENP